MLKLTSIKINATGNCFPLDVYSNAVFLMLLLISSYLFGRVDKFYFYLAQIDFVGFEWDEETSGTENLRFNFMMYRCRNVR